ncbi:MAG: hypothetical protein U0X91_21455 [Spirosomataceae bacterium]
MYRLSLLFLLIISQSISFAQSTLITPGNGQASIQATTNTNGVLIPRMNTTERNQITNKSQGTTIYNTESNKLEYWDGTQWQTMVTNYNTAACDEYCPPRPVISKTIGLDYYLGNSGTDMVNAVALATPNAPTSIYYVTGRANQFLSNSSGYFLSNYNAVPQPWERRAANASGYDVAVDGAGNIYTTGYFSTNAYVTTDFGSGSLTSQGGNDIFLAKYDQNGTLLWVRTAGSPGDDLGKAIAFDASNNVYLTGYFSGTVSAWGINSAGGKDIFIATYNSNGTFLSASRAGGPTDDEAKDINLTNGFGVIGGYFTGTAGFGANNYTSNGGTDMFLATFNSSGIIQKTLTAGGLGDDIINGIFSFGNNGIFLTGSFSDILTLPALPTGTMSVSSAGGKDMFLAKLVPDYANNNDLKVRMLTRGGGPNDDEGIKVSVVGTDPSSAFLSIFVAGNFSGNADFGGPFLVSNTNSGFLAKYNALGQYEYGRALSKTSNSSVTDLTTPLLSDKPYTVGSFTPFGWNNHGAYQPIMQLWTMP